MCGICGQISFNTAKPKVIDIKKMLAKLANRGPDFSDTFFLDNIAFGHSRLAIIDLSTFANQPMVDKELGLTIVFNGTIYNYKKLRQELIAKGYNFFSRSDTEIIIKAYHLWGEDCVQNLDGMFAFCIYHHKNKTLFLARDRMGIKPLYFTKNNNYFSFASNTQALLALNNIDKTINKKALQLQLSLHAVIPAPDTILSTIKKVKPATTLTINQKGEIIEKTYWQPQARRLKNITDAEYITTTHDLLIKAVTKRIDASDVPIGVLLSGGLDSSLIVALLAEANHKDIRTFSIGFEDIKDETGSEFQYSDQVVDKFKTKHKKYIIANSKVLPHLTDAVSQMAEPMVAQDAVAFYLLAKEVSQDVKVVLSGQGADEAFGGYFWYPKMDKEQGLEIDKFSKHYIDRSYNEYLQTINKDFQAKNHTKKWLKKQFQKPYADEFLDKVFLMDITRLIVDDPVKRVDNMTMAWGLEARVPFMDTELIEWSLAIPPKLKLKENGKYPLKHIARKLLPKDVIDRKKGYFPMPALKYIQGEYLEFMVDILNSNACVNRGVFNRKFINKIIAHPDNYMTALQGSRLWHLALLELWLQINVDS